MTIQNQELMNSYIYQVTRRLPRNQRKEVSLDLQELIGDMVEKDGSMEAALTELGDPEEFAKKYRDETLYLIGPEYFDTYMWFLKVVLICSVSVIFIVSVINNVHDIMTGANANGMNYILPIILYKIAGALANILVSAISVFGSITLVFAIMERLKFKINMREKPWSIHELTPIPPKNALISRSDSIVSIVFIVIFSVLLIFAPHFFAAIINKEEIPVFIPVFNLNQWNVILPVLIVSLFLGLVDEIIRLVVGCYCHIVMVSNIICNMIQILLAIILLKFLPFWNPDFATQMLANLRTDSEAAGFFQKWNFNIASDLLLALIIIIALAETGVTIYKTLRYSEKKK